MHMNAPEYESGQCNGRLGGYAEQRRALASPSPPRSRAMRLRRMQRRCKLTAPWAAQPQIYSAADDALVTGPASLAGATGSGTAQSPFEKTISLPFGQYKVGSSAKAPGSSAQHAWAMQQRRILQLQQQLPSCIAPASCLPG